MTADRRRTPLPEAVELVGETAGSAGPPVAVPVGARTGGLVDATNLACTPAEATEPRG